MYYLKFLCVKIYRDLWQSKEDVGTRKEALPIFIVQDYLPKHVIYQEYVVGEANAK